MKLSIQLSSGEKQEKCKTMGRGRAGHSSLCLLFSIHAVLGEEDSPSSKTWTPPLPQQKMTCKLRKGNHISPRHIWIFNYLGHEPTCESKWPVVLPSQDWVKERSFWQECSPTTATAKTARMLRASLLQLLLPEGNFFSQGSPQKQTNKVYISLVLGRDLL